jgi:hypothetical protein
VRVVATTLTPHPLVPRLSHVEVEEEVIILVNVTVVVTIVIIATAEVSQTNYKCSVSYITNINV